jgi:hypothetical protein
MMKSHDLGCAGPTCSPEKKAGSREKMISCFFGQEIEFLMFS